MRICFLSALFVLLCTCSSPREEYRAKYETDVQNPEFLHRSLKEITDRIVHDIFSPPVSSRIYIG